MALGTDTYKGLGLLKQGNALIRGLTTAEVLTIEHSSHNQGNFLVLRDSPVSSIFPDSTATDLDLLRFTGSGGMTAIPVAAGDAEITGFRHPVVESTVGQALTVLQSGTLFVVSSAVGTSMTFDLPVGSDVPGTWYEFWLSSDITSGDVRIAASSNVAAKIHASMLDASSLISTYAAVTIFSTARLGSFFARITALTSLLWLFENNSGNGSSVSTLTQITWKVASTAA